MCCVHNATDVDIYADNIRQTSTIHTGVRAPRRTCTYTCRCEYRGWMWGWGDTTIYKLRSGI